MRLANDNNKKMKKVGGWEITLHAYKKKQTQYIMKVQNKNKKKQEI